MSAPGALALRGAPAAPGLALGPAFAADAGRAPPPRAGGDPETEAAALTAARAAAGAALRALMAQSDDLRAEILEFHAELLVD
jgi:Phosphoenolpyruvate-protein kinase (PTS system EI component in bacteria)